MTKETETNREKFVKIIVPLKNLNNFRITFEMPSVSCETTYRLTWSKNCFLPASIPTNQRLTFTIIDRKFYVLNVT